MSEIQSLARGLKILDLLGQSREGVSITELAAVLGVDKGSASRLVATLAHYGYAEKDAATRRYHLGPQVVSLSRSLLLGMPLREAARPFLRQLTERTGECSHLAVLMQGKALYVDQVESPATLRVNVQVGQTAPLHCTALGKVLLAYGGQDLPSHLEAFTPRTLTDPGRLAKHLAQVRQQGYAVDDEEYDPGVRCVAVPVFDLRKAVAGAIGISGPTTRMTRERTVELAAVVLEIGQALSERLQFTRA
jgi:IclR family acetate operon transcriptional repressor